MLYRILGILALAASAVICACTGVAGAAWVWKLPLWFCGCFLMLLVLFFFFLWFVVGIVDDTKPQEKDSPFYRKLIYIVAEAICPLLLMRVRTQGLEKLPADGRFLLVCNHLEILDPVVLYAKLQKSQLAFISKRENNSMFLVGKAMHKLMAQLINRENDREALKTILRCIQLIKDDVVSIAVFPEGYTSQNGRLQHLRPGVFKIAMKANVPIAVCTLTNTHKVFRNVLHLKPTTVDLHLVEVIPAEELKGHTAVDISNRVYADMLQDLGPDYAPLEVPAAGTDGENCGN